jgi:hypothetical protein
MFLAVFVIHTFKMSLAFLMMHTLKMCLSVLTIPTLKMSLAFLMMHTCLAILMMPDFKMCLAALMFPTLKMCLAVYSQEAIDFLYMGMSYDVQDEVFTFTINLHKHLLGFPPVKSNGAGLTSYTVNKKMDDHLVYSRTAECPPPIKRISIQRIAIHIYLEIHPIYI